MNLRHGIWAVVASFVAYAALYWHHVIGAGMPLVAQFSYFVGSCSALCMALGMLLAARPRTPTVRREIVAERFERRHSAGSLVRIHRAFRRMPRTS